MNDDVKVQLMTIYVKWGSDMQTITDNKALQDKTGTLTSNATNNDPMHGKDETRTLHGTNDTTSCIPIQLQTQSTLMEIKLDAYTNKFRVNRFNFDNKDMNMFYSAINNALNRFINSIKLETFHTESILENINNLITDGLNSSKNIHANIENQIKTGK